MSKNKNGIHEEMMVLAACNRIVDSRVSCFLELARQVYSARNRIHEEMLGSCSNGIESLILVFLAALSLQDKRTQQDNRIDEEMLVLVAIESLTLLPLSSSISNTKTGFLKRGWCLLQLNR